MSPPVSPRELHWFVLVCTGFPWCRELVQCFQDISEDPSCRAVVISGAGSAFTAGIDLSDLGSLLAQLPQDDAARRAWALRRRILEFQESFSVMERVGTDDNDNDYDDDDDDDNDDEDDNDEDDDEDGMTVTMRMTMTMTMTMRV
ncbi:delta(3,5)-Delta(2,4)-dienoyl-CoA isomerase, mitochondrial-like, partial [Pyrgilauda ruficollis]|uniref:delta(3,5)-Delta(2,4)-dienoyl-CoA isomerase, mitochondrial-like n=1 Tax=Pyrgilauda ruficollis TaxID=221976 RepID=UPI001B881F8E